MDTTISDIETSTIFIHNYFSTAYSNLSHISHLNSAPGSFPDAFPESQSSYQY
jgi:hypothetical protein